MSTPPPQRKPATNGQENNNNQRSRVGGQEKIQLPRSAFICYFDSKKKEIFAQNGGYQSQKELMKIAASHWSRLSKQERAHWDEEARNDKVRYVQEKAEYKGELKVPKRRKKKDKSAPKRPMSAFLKYSKLTRASVKKSNPELSNTDVSRLLGEMWRNSSPIEKKPYVEQELIERESYKVSMKKWREEQAKKDIVTRTPHEEVQQVQQPRLPEPPRETSVTLQEPHDFAVFEPFRIQSVEEAIHKVDERMSPQGHAYPSEFLSSGSGVDQVIHRRYPYHDSHLDSGNRPIQNAQNYPLPPFQYHYAPGYAHHRESHYSPGPLPPSSDPSLEYSSERKPRHHNSRTYHP